MNNALSLPKMQRICNDAYRTKSVVSHTVLTNNFAWQDWLAPHVIPKTMMAAGITKVSSQRILSKNTNWFILFALDHLHYGQHDLI